jgi:SpoVK/Ycf46/Vps4 family AAA+-type ATPase
MAVFDRAQGVVTLADVGGRAEVKTRLRALGDTGRLLLYGPPGCGKAFLARALAGELGARFIHVSLANTVDLLEVFARAGDRTVLLLDEVHAAGHRLLAELDAHRSGFVIGATSAPWQLSPAVRHRFSHALLVPPPDHDARAAILRDRLEDRPLAEIDFGTLATRTAGMTGTDLVNVCAAATERTMLDSAATGTTRSIGIRDLNAALAEIRPSAPAWFDTARYDAEGWDELVRYLRNQPG